MKRQHATPAIGLVLMLLTSNAQAETRICSTQEARYAETVASTSKSWKQLHQLYARYKHCDDGAIGEGFSESTTLLLAENWNQVILLESLLRSDPSFRKFVIRHIDETVPADRLKRIVANASTQCPRGLTSLCREIKTAAE